ncbi:hypothetical protein [uncultured Lutibacter sp.]|uniref:hypothetical protein n=1 Tax=uncultured Lutibacter sp. TaxID=437739 RepID=UPI0026307F70|nr:hypothetical protein [uncultured Lutibacter sp.]
MKSKFNILMLGFCFMLNSFKAFAISDPPTPTSWPGGGEPGLPIGGLLPYLIISGVFYGIYELRKKRD